MSRYPDMDSITKVQLPQKDGSTQRRQRIMFIVCFAVLIFCAAAALVCAFILKNKFLAAFVFLILLFWLIITGVIMIRAKRGR